jgi:hypothetical protein
MGGRAGNSAGLPDTDYNLLKIQQSDLQSWFEIFGGV